MDYIFILIGAIVGLIVGFTGIGGGALMTPILLLLGIPPNIAIGTDLWFATITKIFSGIKHYKMGNVNLKIVGLLLLGSLSSTLIVGYIINNFLNLDFLNKWLTLFLSFILIITSIIILFKDNIKVKKINVKNKYIILIGILLGVFVTLSSIGAGVIGTILLIYCCADLKTKEIIGTEIVHAIPLTLSAGIVYLSMGFVDFKILFSLIIGSVPATLIGSFFTQKVSNKKLTKIIGIILLLISCVLLFKVKLF